MSKGNVQSSNILSVWTFWSIRITRTNLALQKNNRYTYWEFEISMTSKVGMQSKTSRYYRQKNLKKMKHVSTDNKCHQMVNSDLLPVQWIYLVLFSYFQDFVLEHNSLGNHQEATLFLVHLVVIVVIPPSIWNSNQLDSS